MTKLEQVKLETELKEVQTAIDEYTCTLVGLTDKPNAAAILLDALDLASSHAGRIRYQLEQAEEN